MSDPFGPARRSLLWGPLMMGGGGVLVYLGIAGDGLAWLLCVLGGVIALLGFIRLIGAAAVLLIEGRRRDILRDGVPSTAVVQSATKTGTKMGYPIYSMELTVKNPDGTERQASRSGAIPHHFDGSVEPGMELPVKVRAEDGEFAVDWGGGF